MIIDDTYTASHEDASASVILELVSDVVAAYVSHNTIDPADIPFLIHNVYSSFTSLAQPLNMVQQGPLEPAVPIKKSITEDYIICLEDGKKLKMLKRHLRAVYKMTPEQYRERWGLPSDYPMVAPNYAKKRSSLAKMNGLGRSSKKGDMAQTALKSVS